MSRLATLEAEFFRTLNLLVEPAVRAGCGFPAFGLTGLITLETKGRRTGLPHTIPVLATLVGDYLLVGTIRGNRSQWIENVRVNPNVRYWLRGRVHEARTLVFTPGESPPETQPLPPLVRYMATSLHSTVGGLGVAFAILIPAQSDA
ncbi:MAG: nitroreductase family deazaflavin-dependent oxidoreductase [Chloroflexi bacterium]|nr:nitroreductase family deazaflavin-dependent oxidoreductase [Chloroflexota bacterium]